MRAQSRITGTISTMNLAALLLATACAVDDGGRAADDPVGSWEDDDRGAGASLGSFQFTYYWVASQSSYNGSNNTNFYDTQCHKIATVPSAFWSAIKLEGTGKLNDGRIVNYAGACNCARSPCFKVLGDDKPWGEGVQGRALEPFRSIAVDKNKIPYGSWMYIPELDGQTMPGEAPWGGWVHDGCVIAADTGSAIVGKHIDFFVGPKSSYTSLINELGLESVTVKQGGTACTGQPPAQPGEGDDGGGDGGEPPPGDGPRVCFPGADGSGNTCLPLAAPSNPSGYDYPSPLSSNYREPVAYLDLDVVDLATKVAPNFTLGEFVSRAKGRYAVLQPHAVRRMQDLRNQLGGIKVNSGYRSPAYNQSVGGANSSRHMFGDGFDWTGTNVSLTKAENACGANDGFLVEYTTHVHCDWRGTDVDALFFGSLATNGAPELPLAGFQAAIERDGLVFTAPATGFDEGEPLRRWIALDADGGVLASAQGESFVAPEGAAHVEVSVGAVIELSVALEP